jgi:hypothetical protein
MIRNKIGNQVQAHSKGVPGSKPPKKESQTVVIPGPNNNALPSTEESNYNTINSTADLVSLVKERLEVGEIMSISKHLEVPGS